MSESKEASRYLLGIDLGVRSLGWAVIDLKGKKPCGIRAAGVRCFEAGVEGDVEKGKDQSRAAARRLPRQSRRQTWRRAQRRRRVLRVLQTHGMIPPGDITSPEGIHNLIAGIDQQLREKYLAPGEKLGHHTLIYRLRSRALDEALEPYELGRVFYHLAQRRGFLSNRKVLDDEKEEGKVREEITKLSIAMKEAGSRTLGEYFSLLDPAEERIRQRWTSRDMYHQEFEAIWQCQSSSNSLLTDEVKHDLSYALFYQRPLKSQSHLIGRCSLMPGRRRAPLACRPAQHFRTWQKVNDLAFRTPGQLDSPLDDAHRQILFEALDGEGDLTFTKIRTRLKRLGVDRTQKFNLEEGGEKKLPGNRTDSKLRPIFGERWDSMSDRERDEIIDVMLGFESDTALKDHAQRKWGLNTHQADEFSRVRLEQDRATFCRESMRRLLSHMETGVPFATARKLEFPESFESTSACDLLPPVLNAMRELRNPAVARALTELRKVVNAISRKWGKPETIRVELARDLKAPRKKRKETWEKNRDNQKSRENASERILRDIPNFGHVKRSDTEKVLLADECGWTCPFTGRGISMSTLLGKNPQFDVEHILPFSKTLDNTYPNKTLCDVDENRHRKRNRTPFEAYGGTPQFDEIIQRVKAFKGTMARAKLARFNQERLDDDFTDAQLQDTRYMSRLAGDYVGLLYGGRSDESGTLRVQVSPGGATAFLRNEWQLNSILGDGGNKTRTNHKHHAVDAIAIALTSPGMVKKLCDAAERRYEAGRRLFAPLKDPWTGFLDQVRTSIDAINVSHRVNHKLSGPLHKETNYSKPQSRLDSKGREVEVRHIRKPVTALSKTDIKEIVDTRIRQCVMAKLEEVGGEVKQLQDNWPMLQTRHGGSVPIKRVRTRQSISVVPVGSQGTPRYVAPGNNHHTVIVARKDKKGRVKWEDHPVTLLEAVKRRKQGLPVIQREWDGAQFVMWFAGGDSLLMTGQGDERLYRCVTVSNGDNWFRLHDDSRTVKQLKIDGDRPLRAGGDKLRLLGARKVTVSPLGEVLPADE